jgi:hypothetical protein
MSHTPGPWRQHSEHPERIILNGSAGYEVRHAWDEDCRPNPADVRLIAAAPELLAALKFAANVIQHHEIDEWLAGEFEIITDAIAKAEGRE